MQGEEDPSKSGWWSEGRLQYSPSRCFVERSLWEHSVSDSLTAWTTLELPSNASRLEFVQSVLEFRDVGSHNSNTPALGDTSDRSRRQRGSYQVQLSIDEPEA